MITLKDKREASFRPNGVYGLDILGIIEVTEELKTVSYGHESSREA